MYSANAAEEVGVSAIVRSLIPCLLTALFLLAGSTAAQNVTTQHNDIGRTGAYTTETVLTPSNVNSSSFGKVFYYVVDGQVYTQPLYVAKVTMGTGTPQAGTTHNVVYIATEHDSVYAFDADSNLGANGKPLWQVSLLDTAHGVPAGVTSTTLVPSDVGSTDISPEIGVTGTPVIDPATGTMYLVSQSKENGASITRLHALDITTGTEKLGGPLVITASVPGNGQDSVNGTLSFESLCENQRPGLLLLNGIVYVGFAAHYGCGRWHGWVLAYDAATLKQTGAWSASPNGYGGSMWESGMGLAANVPDPVGHPFGYIYTATGNGTIDPAPPYTNAMDYAISLVKLDLTNGVPSILDDFTPFDAVTLNGSDKDQGSSGPIVLPDVVGGGKHLFIQAGKSGRIYLLDQTNLGGYHPGSTPDPQAKAFVNGVFGVPAYWNGNVYFWAINDNLRVFSIANGVLSSSATSVSPETSGFPGVSSSVSSNGASNGIVWSVRTDAFNTPGPAILYAHDATNVASTLYSSAQNPARDTAGNAVKFVAPTIVNGRVYVGGQNNLSVYGELNGATQAAAPAISPGGQLFHPSIQVTITDSTPNAQIFYTTDGSVPSTGSTLYTGPFTVTSTETVKAMATGSGILGSTVSSETYTLVNQIPTPTFSPAPGDFTTTQPVAISTNWSNPTIYYTTDGSTPTTASAKYTSPVAISATTTVKAIATAPNIANSAVASGLYTIVPNAASSVDFHNGFSSGGMALVGSSSLNGSDVRLTDGGTTEASAAWYPTRLNVQGFSTDFTFQQGPGTSPVGDGLTFAIQGVGTGAVGLSGGALGYGAQVSGGAGGIANSVAVKFALFNNGKCNNCTGMYTNGAAPITPETTLGGGVNLQSFDIFAVHIAYDGTTLTMTITDTVDNSKTFTTSWTVDIPTTVGGSTAFVGFTGGTGHYTIVQDILSWTYVSTATGGQQTAATPVISPTTGTFTSAQTVTITDATSGSSIFYTTDGSQPTTSSTQYSNAFTVSTTATVKAIATAPNFLQSATATSVITINPQSQTATPVISPVTGTYSSTQTVSITDATSGSSIFYTVDGSQPTTSSTQYTGGFSVSTTTTVKAIATAPNFTQSNTATSVITIQSGGGTPNINFGSGFTAAGLSFNGRATINGSRLQLTDGGAAEASSAWFATPVNVQAFTTDFQLQLINANADGMTFAIQNAGPAALGSAGGGLGYASSICGSTTGIPTSLAVKFDLFQNCQEGNNSTGLYTNGASPTVPAVTLGGGVSLHSGDILQIHMTYDGTTLTMSITDTATNATFTTSWTINIPATVGGNTAFVGFTGGTGGQTATQQVISWTYSSSGSTQQPAATPVISPATGTFTSAQTVTITDATSGSTIYYTLDGSQPTTSSTQYTGSFAVNTTTTVKAMATASGFTQSATATSVITINQQSPAATPVITPATGTFSSAQTVTITDGTSGATIFYTIDGSQPTTTSKQYTASFTVSSTTTVKAIATASGFTQSNTATSVITIQSGSPTINFGGGFSAGSMSFNGRASLNGTRLRLTDGGQAEASSAWFTTPVNVQSFTNDFNFQVTNPNADGMAFVIQNAGTTALGGAGGGLGYASSVCNSTSGILTSVAVKFDLFQNCQEGNNSTGLYTNGASPTVPATTFGGGINLHSGDIFHVHMTYDGTTLTMTITDTVTNATFTTSWTVNIPTAVGGSTAFVGFTAGTGGQTATQEIITWTYGP